MKLEGRERILVVKPSSLGDIVHTLPAVDAIHRTFPETRIDWLANTEWSPLLQGIPPVHRVICFPRRKLRGLGGIWKARSWTRTELEPRDYDVAIDFQGLLRSALLARRSGADRVIGFRRTREGASLFYGESVDVPGWSRRHAVDRNLELAAALGADIGRVEFPLPPGDPLDDCPDRIGEAVVLHPFSRGTGKSLSAAEIREFCTGLSPRPVLLVGIPPEPLDESWPENATDLLGATTLPQLIHLVRSSAWAVSVDSGPLHLAAGLTDRVLSLHTWSNPAMVGPWPPEAWTWREGAFARVRDLDPERFPEERHRKAEWGGKDRITTPEEMAALVDFLRERLAS